MAVLAVCAAAVLIGAPPATARAAQSAPAPVLTQGTDPAVQGFGGCLRGRKNGDLLVLIDESGSLAVTDPLAARVSAANYLLGQLNSLATRAQIRLDVQVAGFASEFRAASDWIPLTTETLPELTSTVGDFRDRDNGFESDYWMAIEGARRALGERPRDAGAAGDGTRCQAITWFTDGKLDIQPRDAAREKTDHGSTRPYAEGLPLDTEQNADEATGLAGRSLCRPGGLADQLRSLGVVTFAVGLAPPGGAPEQDFDLLRSIATGASTTNGPCGTQVGPPPGSFRLASDIDDLLFAFDDIVPPDVLNRKGICPAGNDACAERHEFVLDESVDGVHILGSVDKPGIEVQLIGTDGTAHRLDGPDNPRPAVLDIGGAEVSYSWQSQRTVTLDLGNPKGAAGWAGLWTLVFVDPKEPAPAGISRSNIHLWGNVIPAWTNQADAELLSGQPTPNVALGLTRTDGTPLNPTGLRGDASLSVALVGQDGKETPVAAAIAKTEIGNPRTLDLTTADPGPAVLRLDLALTTASARRPGVGTEVTGTALAPRRVDIPLRIELPRNYPRLVTRADFGTLEFENGAGDSPFELTTPLSFTGPGCAWLEPSAPTTVSTSPDRVSGLAVRSEGATSAATCVSAAEGERKELRLRLSGNGSGSGTAGGTVTVSTAPLGQLEKVRTVDVAFTADLRKELHPVRYWLVLLASVVLGLLIPVGLLYLARWFTKRIPDEILYAKRIPIVVDGETVLRDGGVTPFTLRVEDLNTALPIPPGGERTRLEVAGLELRPRVGWEPCGAGYVSVVTPEPGVVAASSADPVAHGTEMRARLPLAVHHNWVLLHDRNGPEDQAEILILAVSEVASAKRDALAASINEKVPAMLRRLRPIGSGGESVDGHRSGRTSRPSPLAGEAPSPATTTPSWGSGASPADGSGTSPSYHPGAGYAPRACHDPTHGTEARAGYGPAEGYGPSAGFGPSTGGGPSSYGPDSGPRYGPTGAGSSAPDM